MAPTRKSGRKYVPLHVTCKDNIEYFSRKKIILNKRGVLLFTLFYHNEIIDNIY